MYKALAAALVSVPMVANGAVASTMTAKCERNTNTGEIEIDHNDQELVRSQGYRNYQILIERDFARGPFLPTWPAPSHRPGWVWGECVIEGYSPKVPEEPAFHLPR